MAFLGRGNRADFADYFSQFIDFSQPMFLTHITDGYSLRDIINSKCIKPIECKHFGNGLIYTFLGRPAYRKHDDTKIQDYAHLFPVCFVVNPNAITSISHIYPFDSGAFINSVFDSVIDDYVVVQDFKLKSEINSALAFVKKVFENSENYYFNSMSKNFRPDDTDIEVKLYDGIARSKGLLNISDDRSSSIEIAANHIVDLNRSNIAGVIMPHVFAKDERYGRFLEKIGICVDHYHWMPRTRPIEHVGQIRDFVADLNRKNGWIS